MDGNALDLIRQLDDVVEAYEVRTFQVVRRFRDGNQRPVTVSVYDAGSKSIVGRYRVEVRTEDGEKEASGNPDNSLEVALAIVHWGRLD